MEKKVINQSSEEISFRTPSIKEKIKNFAPVFLFLPLLLFISGDATALIANEVLIIAEFQLTEFEIIGAIIGVGQIVMAFSTFAFGYLADKYKRKTILIAGGLIWATGQLLCALAPSAQWLLVFRIISSIGAGSSAPLTISLLSDIFPAKERGNSFAWWGMATTIGGLASGAVALGFNKIDSTICNFADEFTSLDARIQCIIDNAGVTFPAEYLTYWRYPFFLMAGLGLVCSLLIFFVKEPKRGSSEVQLHDLLQDQDVDYSQNYRIKFSDLKNIYKRKSNFWLIVNFVDTIFSGLIVGFILVWLDLEVGIKLNDSNQLMDQLPILIPFVLILVVSLLWGQFWFAKKGDQLVKKGDYAGRVKVAIFCGVTHVPFLIIAFLFYPDLQSFTFFKGDLVLAGNTTQFALIFTIMALILGIGLGLEFGIAPAWYASMIDVNLPEQRGSMIAAASFMDAIGRGIGSWLGAVIIDYFNGMGSSKPISDTIVFCTLTFGILSSLLWLPILKYSKKDFKEVQDILAQRAKALEEEKQKHEALNPQETTNTQTNE